LAAPSVFLQGDDPEPQRAVEYLLHTARRRLQMEAAFLAELTETEQIYRATADAESFTIVEGASLPRVAGYCRRVMESGAPWVIRDTSIEPEVRDLAITSAGQLAAYIGVPVTAPDGRPFGTLCAINHTPRPDLGEQDVAILQALADVLGYHVDQLEQRGEAIDGLEEQVDVLVQDLERQGLAAEVFRFLVDTSLSPTLLLDPATLQVEYANRAAAAIAGVEASEMVDARPWDLHACWGETELRRRVAPLRDLDAEPISYRLAPVDGCPAMDVEVQRLTTGTGLAFLLWVGHDVSAHREASERLRSALELEREVSQQFRQVDSLRNSFLTAVSHELRTPLAMVKGAAETLRSGRASAALGSTLLERLSVNADRLDRLLSDLLDLNQFAHGSLELRREPVRLDDAIRDVVEALEVTGRPVVLDLEAIEARVAPVKFERIVDNLVRNASIHTPPGTPVEVHLSGGDDGTHLVVSDQGPGVPVEDRELVFRPFQQGVTAPSHRPGTGIGLSLVAAFTQLHGGRVWVESAPGGGARFHVVLPTDGSEV
jgi:signal transduction histidine kinase